MEGLKLLRINCLENFPAHMGVLRAPRRIKLSSCLTTTLFTPSYIG